MPGRPTRRTIAALAAALSAIALGACGDDEPRRADSTGPGAETAPAPEPTGEATSTVDVSEREYLLEPPTPRIEEAGVVEFNVKNDGKIVHALEIETPGGEFETKDIDPGDSATLKAELKDGTYEWYCPIANHKELGMVGKVTVGGGAPESGTGTDRTETETEPGDDSGGGGRNRGRGGGEDRGGSGDDSPGY